MKIIVSTKKLAVTIKQAIDLNVTEFEVSGKFEVIRFKSKGIPSLDLYGGTTREFGGGFYKGVFNIKQWTKILSFILQLEEQPVVIEFTHYMHTDIHENPEIEFSQFVKRF